MHSPSNGIRVLGIVCLVLATSVSMLSQTTTGRILGSVSDQTGAGVSGATVAITDVQRGNTRTVFTDAAGEYSAPELEPGDYRVRAEAKGFKTVERTNISVEVASDLRTGFRDSRSYGRGSSGRQHLRHLGRHAKQRRDK
jgi:hypothetical protein